MPDFLPLSVVVAVHNAAASLATVLESIRSSSLRSDLYELIVVDDSSEDRSPLIAARYADTVVRLTGGRCGPAYARNRGFEVAEGRVIAFVDEDVVVGKDTLERMLEILDHQPDVDAVSASHDYSAGSSNFVSRYWNALVRFGEERHAGNRDHFVAGCAMIRRNVFTTAGMYDEWRFHAACLETAELGERIRDNGRRIMLSAELKVAHIKHWDLASLCNELWRRGRTLARLLGYGAMRTAAPSEVVFTLTRTLTPALALSATVLLAAAFLPSADFLAKSAVVLAVLGISNLPVYRSYANSWGLGFAIVAAPLHLVAQVVAGAGLCVGWLLRGLLGDPGPDAATQAYAEVGLETWPPVRRRV